MYLYKCIAPCLTSVLVPVVQETALEAVGYLLATNMQLVMLFNPSMSCDCKFDWKMLHLSQKNSTKGGLSCAMSCTVCCL